MKFIIISFGLLMSSYLFSVEDDGKQKNQVDFLALTQDGETLCASIVKKIDALLPTSAHELYTHHLRSLRSLVLIEWGTITLNIKKDVKGAKAFVKFANIINKGLDGDAAKWETYAQGRRPLIRGYVTAHDRAFSYYTIRLPADWQADKNYQSTFYLHGYTPQPYMTWMVHYGFKGEAAPVSSANHYNIGIWGRGNSNYRYAGEIDLDAAVEDFQTTFVHDESRMVLCGHSMGSFGSWAYAISRPDLWSALGLYSGGDQYAPIGSGLAQNIAHLPIHIWHGAKDLTVVPEMAERFRVALNNFGNYPKIDIDPEGGHMVTRTFRGPNRKWLLSQKPLQRPNPLRFKAISARYNKAWGITLRVDPSLASHPSYVCRIEGNVIHLTTQGTSGVVIHTGVETSEEKERRLKNKHGRLPAPRHLGLAGNVRLYWNGQLSYKGPIQKIILGDGVADRWILMAAQKKKEIAATKKQTEIQRKE